MATKNSTLKQSFYWAEIEHYRQKVALEMAAASVPNDVPGVCERCGHNLSIHDKNGICYSDGCGYYACEVARVALQNYQHPEKPEGER